MREAKKVLLQAFSATEAIGDEHNKSLKVSRVSQALVRVGEFDRALAAVNAIANGSHRARAMRELTPALVLAGQQGEAVASLS